MNTADNTMFIRWYMLIVLLLGGAIASAQPTMAIQESLDAFNLVDKWVRDWEVPAGDQAGEQAEDQGEIEPVSASVVIVTLRLDGRVFGRASAISLDPSETLVYEAATRALDNANAKLDIERDAMWETYMSDLASRVTITLEIADTLVPMSRSELDLPGFGYTPGAMGVAVTRGDRIEAIGPESMLMRNTDMTQSSMAIANSLAGDGSAMLRSPSELAQSGYRFYRFEPIVLTQPGESMGAAFLHRGGRVVDQSEISLPTIRVMSSNIARHLMSRRWAGVEHYGFMGTLDPAIGASTSPFASPFEQAIGAYALLRFGQMGTGKVHRDAIRQGTAVLRDLAMVEAGEPSPWGDKVGSCMAVIALSEIQLVDILGDEQLNELRIKSIAVLDGLYSQPNGFDESVPSDSHGLVTHALVCAAKLDPRDRIAIAQGALKTVFDDTPAPALVGQMPFLGWAAMELDSAETRSFTRDPLLEMRGLVWGHQLHREDLAWMDRDLVGGIVFTSSSTPLPSWLMMRPLAFVSTMLGDEQLTPGSATTGAIPIQIGRQIESVRFIRQLCADTENLHAYHAGKGAMWGVRKALWDQRMSVEADAMALLTLTETTRSFDAITARLTP